MSQSLKIARLFLGVTPFLALACVPAGDGVPPNEDQVYFPVGLTVSHSGEHLFVVNSDFDLQFSQGTIQSLDIERIREIAATPCSADSDCSGGETCDTEPTAANGQSPSFFCVDSSGVPCEEFGEKPKKDLAVAPGRCAPIDLADPADGGASLLVDVAETSAFATQGVLLRRPCLDGSELVGCADNATAADRLSGEDGVNAPERLFLPVRGDTTVHYVDIEEGRFTCGRAVESGTSASAEGARRCAPDFRVSKGVTYALSDDGELRTTEQPPDPTLEEDEEVEEGDPIAAFRLPPEPIDLAASHDGRTIVVTHQLGGYASTLINSWTRPPELVHILEGLPDNPIGVVGLPASDAIAADDQPGFLVTFRNSPQVDLLRFIDDDLLEPLGPGGPSEEQLETGAQVFRPFLTNVASSAVALNSAGFDNRGVAVDSSQRDAAVAACGDDAECAADAETIPLDVYVANRTPNSLIIGRTGGSDPNARVSALPQFYENIPLTAGPSRVVIGHVTRADGEKELRVFVLCFDSALIYIYDPATKEVEAEIRTGRGPYSMAFDEESSLAFVGHFTDSYVGVVSLDQRHPMTFGATLATLGDPQPPRASQ